MNAHTANIILIAICLVGITTVVFIIFVRGHILKFLYKIGLFKKGIMLDDHERDIS